MDRNAVARTSELFLMKSAVSEGTDIVSGLHALQLSLRGPLSCAQPAFNHFQRLFRMSAPSAPNLSNALAPPRFGTFRFTPHRATTPRGIPGSRATQTRHLFSFVFNLVFQMPIATRYNYSATRPKHWQSDFANPRPITPRRASQLGPIQYAGA